MMNINNWPKHKISYLFLEVVNRLMEIDKKTRYYGTDKPLFYAEIHMLKAIKENEGVHITGLAQNLGVTKGAVSQMLFKLEKKGFITKGRDLDNQCKFLIKLTSKGEIAHENHLRLHERFDEMVGGILSMKSEGEREFLKNFFIEFSKELHDFEENEIL